MTYIWKQCRDQYQRIEAWKASQDVYILVREGWFWDKQTKIRVRFLPKEQDIELLIGTGEGDITGAFMKLSANGTPTDIAKQAVVNRQILERAGLEPEDLLKASIREISRYRSVPYAQRCEEALEKLCARFFRGQTL